MKAASSDSLVSECPVKKGGKVDGCNSEKKKIIRVGRKEEREGRPSGRGFSMSCWLVSGRLSWRYQCDYHPTTKTTQHPLQPPLQPLNRHRNPAVASSSVDCVEPDPIGHFHRLS